MISGFDTRTSIGTMTRTPRATRPRRAAALAAAFLVTLTGLTSIAGAAVARPGDPVEITFGQPEDTVYYGNDWYIEAKLRNHECRQNRCDSETLQVTLKGGDGFSRTEGFYVSDTGVAYISSYEFGGNLAAGSYTLTGKYKSPYRYRTSPSTSPDNKPGTLTVVPAPLSIDLRIETDENQPAGAVVSSQLLGDFVEKQNDCYEGSPCKRVLADGTWAYTITGTDGETLVEKSIATKGNPGRFASFYWHDVPSSSNYTASATFTPVTSAAGNFAIEAPGAASFTSPAPIISGDPGAEEEPVVAAPDTSDSSIPLWGVLGWFAGVVILLAVAAVFLVLLLRQRRAARAVTTGEAVAS